MGRAKLEPAENDRRAMSGATILISGGGLGSAVLIFLSLVVFASPLVFALAVVMIGREVEGCIQASILRRRSRAVLRAGVIESKT